MAVREQNSFRIGVRIDLAVRLFSRPFELGTDAKGQSVLPAVGPSARDGGSPKLVIQGTKGQPDYRRRWTVSAPAKGSSPLVYAQGGTQVTAGVGPTTGFDDATPVAPPTLVPLDSGAHGPVLVGSPGDQNVARTNALARRVKWRNSPHRVGDQLELELPIEAFPFPADGSIVRSVLVEMRRGLISADDWSRAMADGGLGADGHPVDVPIQFDSDQPDFVGFADVHKIKMGDSTSVVTLPCRDFAGFLADTKSRGRTLSMAVPVDQAIAEFCASIPAMVGIDVVWFGPDDPSTHGNFVPRPKLTKKGKVPLAARKKAEKTSCLDMIADYCTNAGIIPSFVGYELRLGPAKTLDKALASVTPRLVLGHNVLTMEMEHKLTKNQAHAVEVVCTNTETGRQMAARWPHDPKRFGDLAPGVINSAPPSGPVDLPPGAAGIDEAAPTVMIVHGITDPAQLQLVARNTFEEMARQDLTLKITTRDVSSFEGRYQGVADLLALRAGDPLAFVISSTIEEQAGSYLQRLASLGGPDAVRLLESKGYERAVAERIVSGILLANRPLIYRVHELEMDWGIDSGTHFEISMINYIFAIDDAIVQRQTGNASVQSGASFEQQWGAINANMLSGAISPFTALQQMQSLNDATRVATVGTKYEDAGTP